MFSSLSEKLNQTLKIIGRSAKLSENNIQSGLREIRIALLEADVALPVVKKFIDEVKHDALGSVVGNKLNPGQAFVKIFHSRLTEILGSANVPLNSSSKKPMVILLAGLQGAGKTTTAAKLAITFLQQRKDVLMVSTDVYRPAAIEQLQTLATQHGIGWIASSAEQTPQNIAKYAIDYAQRTVADVLIIDTAGRSHLDAPLMDELRQLAEIVDPVETLFVIDAMAGQSAVATAKTFNDTVDITGIILTKADSDTRGGAALSVRSVTGKPIKYLGVGENIDALEAFHPERMASRILGMGDMLSFIEEAQRSADSAATAKLQHKLKTGKPFNLADFKNQLQQMQNMGGIDSMIGKIPGMGGMAALAQSQMGDAQTNKFIALINSMTPRERIRPDVINPSRKRRITIGSGLNVVEINKLLKQFKQMQKMMRKSASKGGMQKMMRQFQQMSGNNTFIS